MQGLTGDIYRFGEFELDCGQRELRRGGKPLALSPKAFDLLQFLVANRGNVLSKDEILDAVWPGQFVEENNLTVQISTLRKVFGGGNFITTLPGRGYSFVADVSTAGDEIVIEQLTIERITVEQTDDTRQLGGRKSRRWPLFAAAAAVVLAISGFAGYRYFRVSGKPKITSVAVLPFVNETTDANNEYLTDGLAESVTYSLSQMPGIRVMSRGSTFRYKGKEANANTIGSELNVQAILTGRVTQRGDTLNISSELVSTADNSVIWGEQFTRKMSDIEKLQTDIASAISDRLRFKFSDIKPGTENAEAYQLYLKGLFYWNKRTESDLNQAVALFQQAIDHDPAYARAYGGLALVYNVIPANMAMTHDEANDYRFKAKATAQKALDLDDRLAEAYTVLGDQKRVDWDFAGSENYFKRAIDLNPNFASAHQWYSEMLARLGRHDEALAEVRKAYELDPLSPAVRMNIGLRLMDAGRADEAAEQFRKLIDSEPAYPMSYVFLGDLYVEKEMYDEGLAMWCKFDVMQRIDSAEKCDADNNELKAALKKGGKPGFWRKLLEQEVKYYERGIATEVDIACQYSRLGDLDRAFAWLEKAFAKHEDHLSTIKINRAFEPLRSDPRFDDLLKRIGLPV